jgi:uncharacterized membrane protein
MNIFPPIPGWNAMHPLVVHFPIALLIIAPVLVVLGLVIPKHARGLFLSALVLMAIGTVGTFIASSTGEAASEMAERVAGTRSVLERHEELAETTRTIFTALTAIFAAILFLPDILKKTLGKGASTALILAFLVFYMSGTVFLANTAHQGGRLVHEIGVRAGAGTGSAQTGSELGQAGANAKEDAGESQRGESKEEKDKDDD